MYPAPSKVGKHLITPIPIRDVMSTAVRCVPADSLVTDAARVMQLVGCGCLVAVDGSAPVGVLTKTDLLTALVQRPHGKPVDQLTVREAMTASPVCFSPDASLYEAWVTMETQQIKHIPIVTLNNQLLGIISHRDIAQTHYHAMEERREAVEQLIRNHAHQLNRANRELKELALQDGLLNIGNRRAMEVDIQLTHANAQRHEHPYTVVLMDVDYFKKYNDHYGHQAGDEVLRMVADCIKGSIRSGDRVYRYGGEELLLLMPATTLLESVEAARRILANVEECGIPHEKSPHHVITLSAGIGSIHDFAQQRWADILAESDRYLYLAKEMGRNQVCWQAGQSGVSSTTGSYHRVQ